MNRRELKWIIPCRMLCFMHATLSDFADFFVGSDTRDKLTPPIFRLNQIFVALFTSMSHFFHFFKSKSNFHLFCIKMIFFSEKIVEVAFFM